MLQGITPAGLLAQGGLGSGTLQRIAPVALDDVDGRRLEHVSTVQDQVITDQVQDRIEVYLHIFPGLHRSALGSRRFNA